MTTDPEIAQSPLYSADLAPVSLSNRKWGTWSMAALWISMAACVPTYMIASSLIGLGMNWWQAILTVFLGNVIVLIPMILNAHAGTKYGIPFPVLCRASFGVRGANIPALMRAIVACGWFGIQAWIGGMAIFKILAVFFPSMDSATAARFMDVTAPQFICFLIFWSINMLVVIRGIDTIRVLLQFKAPLLIALGLLLLAWAYRAADGWGPMLSQPSLFDVGQPKHGQFWNAFLPSLTGMIGFWATLSLNIPDFSRFARSQRAQMVGQAIGLPVTMALYAFIGVAVTSATTIVYGAAIWDPVDVLTRFTNPAILIIAMFALCIATLVTNLAANVVGPANDFANVAPKHISFRTGGIITGVIGILIMPWKLIADPSGYIFIWLVGYSALLGPIGGILICDYFLLRRTQLNLRALYTVHGAYSYLGGFNPIAIIALVLGIAPCVPGFLVEIHALEAHRIGSFWTEIYSAAWFVGFGISAITHFALSRAFGRFCSVSTPHDSISTTAH
ncbi:MAG: NCS1 family nucleobase:cation symporter-1 [Planctomycetota bacterium]|nr:NCS1 family nucleobase:cation symporter-1 [Planctomycetota bacterium]